MKSKQQIYYKNILTCSLNMDTMKYDPLKIFLEKEIKKEKLWIAGDVNKWGLTNEDLWNASILKTDKPQAISRMLHKETIDTERIKDEYAYFNFQSRSEVRRFLLDNQLIDNLHFTEFARSMCNHTTKIHVNWGELIANLSQIRSENIPSRSFIPKDSKHN